MSSAPLSGINRRAQDMIEFFDPSVQNKIAHCVRKYSSPQTFCDLLSYIVYRVSEAFKSIVGRSDWQKTVKAIAKQVEARNLLQNVLPKDPEVRRIALTMLANRRPFESDRAPSPDHSEMVLVQGDNDGNPARLVPQRSAAQERELPRVAPLASKSNIPCILLREIIQTNDKTGMELVEDDQNDRRELGPMETLLQIKAGYAFMVGMRDTLKEVFSEEMALTSEAARDSLAEVPQEERREHLAFLAMAGIDARTFAQLTQELNQQEQ
ncbi:MAG: hypothetical protein JSS32_00220 [Verrucomicrobia bacterium]|nr:hypothetical protein [Verrucomicrobiota bacterium]